MSDPHIILDAHLDIAYNALVGGRDFTHSVYQTRQRESGLPEVEKIGALTAALPEALLGRVGIVFGTIFTLPLGSSTFSDERVAYTTPREAYERGLAQWDVYQRLADENAAISLIRTQSELESVLATWQEGVEFAGHKLGILLSIEGGDPIIEPPQFEEWYARGVRAVGPAWGATRYTGGTGHPGPLTALGRELLEVMASFNAILDISHMAQEAALESLDRYEGTLIASHSNARRFSDTDRHLTDDMIRQLAERDGVMGIPLYNRFLKRDWALTDPKNDVTLNDVIAAIDHVCQLTGSAQHVGIGSDFDGGFGNKRIPAEFDTITDLTLIEPALKARGYSPDDIANILSGNFLRILRRTLPS